MANAIDLLNHLIESYFAEARNRGETNTQPNYEISDLVITTDKIVATVEMTGTHLTKLCGLQPGVNGQERSKLVHYPFACSCARPSIAASKKLANS